METFPASTLLPLEIRVHGRGGQGGVTCAKLCAMLYSRLGLYAQTFGDYGMERAGAPVRAYTRIDRNPIKNRNKVYSPAQLLILDPSLLESGALAGVKPGSLVLLNTSERISSFHGIYDEYRFAVINATDIARRHGIGTSAVVIVNTAFVGAYARVLGFPIDMIKDTYSSMGLLNDFEAAREAFESVAIREVISSSAVSQSTLSIVSESSAKVIPLTELVQDMPTPLKTGSWRTQTPQYVTLKSPCNQVCPAGNDVVGFIQKLETDGLEAAADVLFRTQSLPSVCGRVCPAPCMQSCNRSQYDGAVNIRGLERWIGDHASHFAVPEKATSDPGKIAVVGGGPAGISAAYCLARDGHKVEIFDSNPKLGGVLRNGIPSYRLPEDSLDRDLARVLALGVTHKPLELVAAQRIEQLAVDYDAVIVATGQSESMAPAEFTGIYPSGVEQGLAFLNRMKFKGQEIINGTVAVIGGGNTALDCAGTAVRCGADRVVIVYRRGRNEMPAIKEEIDDIVAEGVELLLCRQPVKIKGDDYVTGLELAEVDLGDPDESGRRRPIVTDNLSTVACDRVLIAIGQRSDLNILPDGWTITRQRAHLGDQPMNVWFAGDLVTGEGTVAHAIGNGRRIACDVSNFLKGLSLPDSESSVTIHEVPTADRIRFHCFPPKQAHEDRRLAASERITGFTEVNLGLAATDESKRCFSCGNCTHCDTCLTYCPEGIIDRAETDYSVNLDYCKGCGVCAWECPRHAVVISTRG
jgi:2-oxoacid:acceptor oxidoreductase gamma subunit (pyruvate/2-ketoisovalerate family)